VRIRGSRSRRTTTGDWRAGSEFVRLGPKRRLISRPAFEIFPTPGTDWRLSSDAAGMQYPDTDAVAVPE
jgi:hypothetical protein